jgi:anti-sigma factor RsiW
MGLYLCERHGDSGMIFGCPHITAELNAGKKPNKVITARFPDESPADDRFRYDRFLFYCPACASDGTLPNQDSDIPRQMFSDIYDSKHFAPNCYTCFKTISRLGDDGLLLIN